MWKALGTNGLARIVEHEFSLAALARSYIKNNSDYVLYDFFEGLTVCFNYKGLKVWPILAKISIVLGLISGIVDAVAGI